jgi:hypothetical protein
VDSWPRLFGQPTGAGPETQTVLVSGIKVLVVVAPATERSKPEKRP